MTYMSKLKLKEIKMRNENSVILITIVSLNAFLFSPTSLAADSLSGNIGITNNYLWRGLEQTNGDAALSGGIDYSAQSGFYAGTWVSNASWDDEMTYELDFYAGFSGKINSLGFDVGFIYFAYPDSKNDVDFSEITASLSYGALSLSYAVLADAEGADFADDSYIAADVSFELTPEVTLAFHVGKGTDDFYAGESFIDYGASLNKSGFTLGISKTDLEDDDMKVYASYSIDINF